MSKKSRFDYLGNPSEVQTPSTPEVLAVQQSINLAAQHPSGVAAQQSSPLAEQSVPRGAGRMQQDRKQLNVRLPEGLKRKALAKAALEGKSIGDVIEKLVAQWVNQKD